MIDHRVIAGGACFPFTSGRIFHDPPTLVPEPDAEAWPPPPRAQWVLPLD